MFVNPYLFLFITDVLKDIQPSEEVTIVLVTATDADLNPQITYQIINQVFRPDTGSQTIVNVRTYFEVL